MGRLLVQLLVMILPWSVRRWALRALLGFELDRSSRIGWSLIAAERVVLGPGARIGSLTFIKGLRLLEIESAGYLGNLNWVTATPANSQYFFQDQSERDPSFIIRSHAAVTHRHLIDCTDRVEIGPFATFGGWGSQILTHSIDIASSRQRAAAVAVGRYCFVGTRVVLLKGSTLPDNCVLAAGSVLSTCGGASFGLYSGTPASRVRELDPQAAYFSRAVGYVN